MKGAIYSKYIKRILDVIISGFFIVALLPLYMIIALLVLVFNGSPVLFKQSRIGRYGKEFTLIKFRSMNNKKDENGCLLPGKMRITKFGRFIRKYSLDELPELFCIFIGKMSIIGPRPLLPESLPYFTERHMHRHDVRPGLACLPLKEFNSWSWNDQFENDIFYVNNLSFLTDFKMLFIVIKEVFKSSEYRVNDTREEYNGTNLYEDALKE